MIKANQITYDPVEAKKHISAKTAMKYAKTRINATCLDTLVLSKRKTPSSAVITGDDLAKLAEVSNRIAAETKNASDAIKKIKAISGKVDIAVTDVNGSLCLMASPHNGVFCQIGRLDVALQDAGATSDDFAAKVAAEAKTLLSQWLLGWLNDKDVYVVSWFFTQGALTTIRLIEDIAADEAFGRIKSLKRQHQFVIAQMHKLLTSDDINRTVTNPAAVELELEADIQQQVGDELMECAKKSKESLATRGLLF